MARFIVFDVETPNCRNDRMSAIGITAVEIGVTVGVAGTIITILDALIERIAFDDDNN